MFPDSSHYRKYGSCFMYLSVISKLQFKVTNFMTFSDGTFANIMYFNLLIIQPYIHLICFYFHLVIITN